jgi:hypothetical protein
MKFSIYKHTIMLFSILMITACSKQQLEEKPPHLITSETLFTNVAGFEAGLNGLYAQVRREREAAYGSHSMMGSMFMFGTDNATVNHQDIGYIMTAMLWKNINNALEPENQNVFVWLYGIVNDANTIINQAEKRNDINWSGGTGNPEDTKNRVIAEAKAIRAWAYRHLTFGWGDVPLALEQSSGSTIKTDWERTPVSQVREQIVKDLLEAEPYIGVEPSLRGRISKGAVQHYLAEMYLTLGNPAKALEWADKVINTPQYKLVTQRYGIKKSKPGVPFMDMFLDGNSNREEGNTEALWVFQFALKVTGGGECMIRRIHLSRFWNISVNGVRPIVHTFDRGGLGYSRFTFTKWALDNYEKTDYRFSPYAIRKYYILGDAATNAPYPADNLPAGYHYGDTIKCKWDPDITYTTRARFDWPYSRKAEGVNPENMNEQYMNNDQVYLRLADTYLLKAEAEFKLGRSQDAANTLNIIRRRSNASEITSAQVNLDFILDERSRELFLEEHRRWTLLRTHKFLERTMAYNKNGGQNLSARDTIYPIPQSVIDANLTKEMPQNPGY